MATNSTSSADAKKVIFSTDISTAYPEEAQVKKWVRSYRLDRGKKFTVSDNYELKKVTSQPTTINFVTYCKVTEEAPGKLKLKGEDFTLMMKYETKVVTPKIEFIEVKSGRAQLTAEQRGLRDMIQNDKHNLAFSVQRLKKV